MNEIDKYSIIQIDLNYFIIAANPSEASRGTWGRVLGAVRFSTLQQKFQFQKGKVRQFFMWWGIFCMILGKMEVPPQKYL